MQISEKPKELPKVWNEDFTILIASDLDITVQLGDKELFGQPKIVS